MLSVFGIKNRFFSENRPSLTANFLKAISWIWAIISYCYCL